MRKKQKRVYGFFWVMILMILVAKYSTILYTPYQESAIIFIPNGSHPSLSGIDFSGFGLFGMSIFILRSEFFENFFGGDSFWNTYLSRRSNSFSIHNTRFSIVQVFRNLFRQPQPHILNNFSAFSLYLCCNDPRDFMISEPIWWLADTSIARESSSSWWAHMLIALNLSQSPTSWTNEFRFFIFLIITWELFEWHIIYSYVILKIRF